MITNEQLDQFEALIEKAQTSNIEYDKFCDNGGIEIAKTLLDEVRRLKSLLSLDF